MKVADEFILVEASKLSLDDFFMQYIPKTRCEEAFKRRLTEVIEEGVKDFWRPKYDPSFIKDKAGICFVSGNKPAMGKSYKWWDETAKKFWPEHGSRLGTKEEYVAFLGCLIKKLVEENGRFDYKVWDAICNDPLNLFPYYDPDEKVSYELTGAKAICGFFDLANTYKILAKEKNDEGFWIAGGNYYVNADCDPLADLCHSYDVNKPNNISVGWLVLEK